MYRKMCILCQQTSPKRWFGNRTMTSFCDVTNSTHQIQMTTLCRWMKPPMKSFCVRHWGREHNSPGAEWLRGAPQSPNNISSIFFNTLHLLPKDVRFKHGGAKLAFWPGRHLTSLRPCLSVDIVQKMLFWTRYVQAHNQLGKGQIFLNYV